jgi:xanthine dehydrogenase molybdenum-binding subunit
MFKVPESKVRVISTYVGAGFGTKSTAHLDEGLTALLARKAGRPVKLQFSREEEILDSNIRYETRTYFKVGVKRDMTLHALNLRHIGNLGAYHTQWGSLGTQTTHLYNITHLKTEEIRVHTNLPNAGPVRGIGDPYENFALESLIDEVAYEMGWDPLEFRLKNIKRTGDLVRRSAAIPREEARLANHRMDLCIQEGAKRIGWERRNRVSGGQTSPRARGIGMAITERDGGAGPGGAIVKVNVDGSVVVLFGTADIGTGCKTTVPMVAAEVLGVPLERVQVVSGDTETTPFDPGSFGNRVIHVSGKAAELAARECLRQILETAAPMLQAKPEELEASEGSVRVKSQPDKKVPLAKIMEEHGRTIVGQGSVVQHITSATIDRSPSAHFAEVEVDKELGKIKLLRYVAVHDAGQPINRTVVDNQIEGGVIQGLAMAFTEELHFDAQKGWCLSPNFLDLKPPTMLDVDPRVIVPVLVENQSAHGPFGAKGTGETTCHAAMAVIANAVYNATGLRIRELPFNRSQIMRALV